MKTVVIKYGGHALDDARLRETFISNLKELAFADFKFVIVHGGGPQITSLLERLSIRSAFVDGLRVTDAATLEAVEMALCGQVNKYITRLLWFAGLDAVGISGEDGGLFLAAQKSPDLGFVGKIVSVNPRLPLELLARDFVPVIAPLALNKSGGALNVNADSAAGALAAALEADFFVLISDVPGVLDHNGSLLAELAEKEARRLIASGVINGGMIPKVGACLQSLERGCESALILNGREDGSLLRYLRDGEPLGTLFRA